MTADRKNKRTTTAPANRNAKADPMSKTKPATKQQAKPADKHKANLDKAKAIRKAATQATATTATKASAKPRRGVKSNAIANASDETKASQATRDAVRTTSATDNKLDPKIKPEAIALHDTGKKLDPAALSLPRIRSMGRSLFDPVWALNDHASNNIELLYILRGQVKVHTADYVLPASEGQLIYTPCGMTHRDVFPLDSAFEVYLIHFHWDGEASMLSQLTPAMLTEASRQDPGTLASDMRQLYLDFQQPGPLTAQLTSLRLLQVLCRLWHHALAGSQRDQEATYDLARARRVQIMTQARQVIDERFGQPLGLDDIADAIEVSPYYLSRVFSQEAGFTLSNYLHDVRMEKAASLLRDPRMAVSQVASDVGFRDAHYFARVFKNHFGEAPSAYRTRLTPPA